MQRHVKLSIIIIIDRKFPSVIWDRFVINITGGFIRQ